MSGKRPADTSGTAGGRRQFKQTKLSFFTPASASQPKGPKTRAEQPQEAQAATTEKPSPRATTDSDGQQQPEKAQSRETTTTTTTTTAKTQPPPPPPSPSTSLTLTLPPSPSPLPIPHTSLPSTATVTAKIHITDRFGDLFAAPPQTLLIHACNALGSWGGGIALAFRARYPAAFAVYRAHCARSSSSGGSRSPDHRLVGTALLIPPQAQSRDGKERGRGHYVGCLFTSRGYGRARDGPEEILRATGPAMRDLMRLVAEEEERTGRGVGEDQFGAVWGAVGEE
ncbi:hypothetical protein NEMBOFW57_010109 [Staphylotrichum longicolle]|uniref:ADP-ribose 1''-phosphate phosphatase n=1 Tax=Staphylotrichum longicolle TaxID=669026 RepID=A0AAD4HW09_9PEZI|nr:hypothetical protein NEMBOFW57_010109 [Staphylotrichum longicolle]